MNHAEVRLAPRSTTAFNIVATCLHELGRPAEAVAHIVAAIDAGRAQNDQMFVAVLLHNLGFTYFVLERHPEAVTAFEDSVAMASELGNRYIHADSLNGIARAMHAQGRVPAAREFHRQALAVFDDLPQGEADRYHRQLDASPLRYPAE